MVTVKAPSSRAGFRPHGPRLQGKGSLAVLQLGPFLGQEEPSIPGGPGPAPYLCLKALFTMALSTRRSPTWEGPRKWNISMAFSVGWARHSRLEEARVRETGSMPQCFSHRPASASPPPTDPAQNHMHCPLAHPLPPTPDTSAQRNRTKVPFHSLEHSGLCMAIKQLSLRQQMKAQGLG